MSRTNFIQNVFWFFFKCPHDYPSLLCYPSKINLILNCFSSIPNFLLPAIQIWQEKQTINKLQFSINFCDWNKKFFWFKLKFVIFHNQNASILHCDFIGKFPFALWHLVFPSNEEIFFILWEIIFGCLQTKNVHMMWHVWKQKL